ncbi:winged helix-turn-helix domain-containing protein [Haladaptatus sp. NG-WS-4]
MTNRPDDPPSRERSSPEEAFSILGNEIRVDILRVLVEHAQSDSGAGPADGLSFSELYDRVDASNSSQFSYHLQKLTGTFVRETETGYKLTYAGDKIARTIRAGTYHERPEFEPVELDGVCLDCHATTLRATYEEEMLVVRCAECELRLLSFLLSPAQVKNRTPREIMQSADRYVRDEYSMALDGVCADCLGRMTSEIQPGREPVTDVFVSVHTCEQCGFRLTSPIERALVYHPAVVTFYWNHGTDIRNESFWKLFEYIRSDRWQTECVSTDPYEFRVTLTVGEDELAVELDETLSVTSARATKTHVSDAER